MTLNELSEQVILKRMKTIIPGSLDVTDYDEELLAKQLELDIVTITLIKETGPQALPQDYTRSVKRSENQEGKFQRLTKELELIALEHKRDLQEIFEEF